MIHDDDIWLFTCMKQQSNVESPNVYDNLM